MIETEINIITKEFCKALDVPIHLVYFRTRKRKIVECRQQIMTFIHENLKNKHGLSLARIGKLTGGFDHSTVIHAIKTVDFLRTTNKNFRWLNTIITNRLIAKFRANDYDVHKLTEEFSYMIY